MERQGLWGRISLAHMRSVCDSGYPSMCLWERESAQTNIYFSLLHLKFLGRGISSSTIQNQVLYCPPTSPSKPHNMEMEMWTPILLVHLIDIKIIIKVPYGYGFCTKQFPKNPLYPFLSSSLSLPTHTHTHIPYQSPLTSTSKSQIIPSPSLPPDTTSTSIPPTGGECVKTKIASPFTQAISYGIGYLPST